MPKFAKRNGNSLWKLIEAKLTTAQQDGLPEALDMTERQVGQRFNSPRLLTMLDIQRLAAVLDVTPAELIADHGAGRSTMTIDEAWALGVEVTAKA